MPADTIDDSADRKETLASFIYDRMRKDIISLEVPPGEKLNIRSLCERFDVGLSPVREALSRLSSEGLVAQSDHRGFTAAPISETDLVDLTRARAWLNEMAIRKACRLAEAMEQGIAPHPGTLGDQAAARRDAGGLRRQ